MVFRCEILCEISSSVRYLLNRFLRISGVWVLYIYNTDGNFKHFTGTISSKNANVQIIINRNKPAQFVMPVILVSPWVHIIFNRPKGISISKHTTRRFYPKTDGYTNRAEY